MENNLFDMIHNGQFGYNSPPIQPNYSMGYNNIIPIGYGYNQPQSYVFQPVQQAPKYDYYNPYSGMVFNNQQQYYQNNPYQYNNYGYGLHFISPLEREKQFAKVLNLEKLKYRIVNHYLGNDLSEDELDRLVNPQNPVNLKTEEEISAEQEWNFIQTISSYSRMPYTTFMHPDAVAIREASEKMHKELDNHSMCTFLMDDLWKFQREEWIRKNIKHTERNLSKIYNSNDYNELLNMHRSSNPYINELLNTSRYDNNINDVEFGMDLAYDKARRRKMLLEGKVPEFISSDETQRRRAEWTQSIINQIYNKGGTVPDV